MLSVKEAQQRILSHFKPLESTFVPLDAALGRILSQDIQSNHELPSFDNSSVDGFAVRTADLASAGKDNPVTLKVVADIPAGSVSELILSNGQAARIMTGAPVPAGADAVVMVEDTDSNHQAVGSAAPTSVQVFTTIRPGESIRRRGTDISRGQVILAAGSSLRPQDIGMLAMLGIASVPVSIKPKVAILSSGDELVPVELPLQPGKIHDSNTHTLSALAQNAGCEVLRLGVAADRADEVKGLLDRAADLAPDMIISSAGVSVGAFDYMRDVVESSGSLNFWKVNMRPGKPLAFGSYRDIPFFGLPGNPVSSFVNFLIFIQPALDLMKGTTSASRSRVKVVLREGIESDGRESYLRARVTHENGRNLATLTGHQGSGNLFSLVQANALLIIPSGVKSCPPGSEVEAWILENSNG
jgi:molybdopterin molybdotransferase